MTLNELIQSLSDLPANFKDREVLFVADKQPYSIDEVYGATMFNGRVLACVKGERTFAFFSEPVTHLEWRPESEKIQ